MNQSYERRGYTVTVSDDPDVPDPREEFAGCGLVLSHKRYNWPNDADINFGIFDGWGDIAAELRMHFGALVVVPVWAYDHSGVSFSTGERTGQFADRWDSGQAGLAYVTAEQWTATQGCGWDGSEEQAGVARRLIAAEIATWAAWAGGETFRYQITGPDGEDAGSCCGYIGWESVTSAADAEVDRLAGGGK
jgi:hypothetical protein